MLHLASFEIPHGSADMPAFPRPEEIEEIVTAHARIEIYRMGGSTLVTRASGHAGVEQIVRLMRRSEELIARVGTIDVVHDWFDITGYDAVVRQKMTPWAIRTRASHRAIHIGTNAGLVRMGVTMVRIATGAPIHAYDTRTALQVALASTITTRRPSIRP